MFSNALNRICSTFVVVVVVVVAATCFTVQAHAIEIKKIITPGGITTWFVKDHTIPLITVNFSFKGGAAADPQDRPGLAHVLAGMIDEGAGDMKSAAFQARMNELAMRLSFTAEHDEFTGSFRTLTRNRDAAFALLKLALSKPRFDEDPVNRIKGQVALSLTREAEDPSKIASRLMMKTMFGDHPYGRRVKGTVQGVKAVTPDDLRSLHGKLFSREGLMISVVGDIKEDKVKELLDDVFGSLPEKSGMPDTPDVTVTDGPMVKIVDRDIPQSIIRFGHSGMLRKDPDFIAAYVMNNILGGGGLGSRLNEQVREKRGLSYSVYSALYPLERAGVFFGGAATVNDRASETIDVIRAELARMAKDGPTEDELEAAKTYLTGSYPLRFDNSRKIAGQLLAIQRQRLGIDYVVNRNDKIKAVTIEDVRKVAARLIRADDLIFTIVGRPKGVKPSGS